MQFEKEKFMKNSKSEKQMMTQIGFRTSLEKKRKLMILGAEKGMKVNEFLNHLIDTEIKQSEQKNNN